MKPSSIEPVTPEPLQSLNSMEDDRDDSKRRTRNLSEKNRRDQFNGLVKELSTMVSTSSRKMDKSTVLKATISFLNNHNDIRVRSRAHDVQDEWKPSFLANEEFTYLVMEALEVFLMVFSASGHILYVSDSVASLLGHEPADLVNQSILDLAHEDDRPRLNRMLQSIDPAQPTQNNPLNFQCHMRRGKLDFREETSYELIDFSGHFRASVPQPQTEEGSASFQQETKPTLQFACTGRIVMPRCVRDVSLVDSSRNEFTSRHSLEWKFLFLDHRAPPIIGYLPFEVLGTSGYDYYHFDDLEKVVACHEALMEKGEVTSCYYRFLTKGHQWIWLQTRFYITYHQWNAKPEFIVCTNRVVNYSEVLNAARAEAAKNRASQATPAPETSQAAQAAQTTPEVVEVSNEASVIQLAPSQQSSSMQRSPSCISEASDVFAPMQGKAESVKSLSMSSTAGTVATLDSGMTSAAAIDRRSMCEVDVTSRSDSPTPSGSERGRHEDMIIDQQLSRHPQLSEGMQLDQMHINQHPQRVEGIHVEQQLQSHRQQLREEMQVDQQVLLHQQRLEQQQRLDQQRLELQLRVDQHQRLEHQRMEQQQRLDLQQHQLQRLEQQQRLEHHTRLDQQLLDQHQRLTQQQPQHLDGRLPSHCVGAQYLDPAPYVGVLPVALPALIVPDQPVHYIDDHLHRKHEELQQMIARQQAELQQVKEQLLLAQLGILPPLLNVSVPLAQVQNQYVDVDMESGGHVPSQLVYDQPLQTRSITQYPGQHPSHPHVPQ